MCCVEVGIALWLLRSADRGPPKPDCMPATCGVRIPIPWRARARVITRRVWRSIWTYAIAPAEMEPQRQVLSGVAGEDDGRRVIVFITRCENRPPDE